MTAVREAAADVADQVRGAVGGFGELERHAGLVEEACAVTVLVVFAAK